MEGYDCFFSYSRADSAIADEAVSMLESNGVKCWMDRTDSAPGLDYAASIVRAIKATRVFIVILSNHSIDSRHVMNELNTAVSSGSRIIPVNIDGCTFNDTMEYYLGRIQWITAWTKPQEWHALLLDSVRSALDSAACDPQPINTPPEAAKPKMAQKKHAGKDSWRSCRMLRYQDLLDLGYTSKVIAMKLVENDYINNNGMADENEGTPDQWEAYLRDESDTFRYLVNGQNEIVGDWSIVAITDECQKRAKAGELFESDFDITTTVKICVPGIYHGYIMTCTVLPEYRTQRNYLLLLNSLFDQIEDYAVNGVFFDCWWMNIFSTDVESLMLSLGFDHIVDNKKSGRVYYLRFMPYPSTHYFRSLKRLAELYGSSNQ